MTMSMYYVIFVVVYNSMISCLAQPICNCSELLPSYSLKEKEEANVTQTCDIWALAISLILFKFTGLASLYLMRKHRELHSIIASYEQPSADNALNLRESNNGSL